IIWPTFFVLLLQAVFFAHGGLTTLGINTLTLGLLGPVTAAALWALFRELGMNRALALGLACALGDLAVYVGDAVVLAVALADVTAPMTTFTAVLLGFAPVQVPLAVLEAVASIGIVRLLAERRPDLLPAALREVRNLPVRGASAIVLLLGVGLSGCRYEGIDGTVFGATAEKGGLPPTQSLIDLSQGEVGLAMSIVILFALGFVAGRSWERLLGAGRDALPR
ncbi:MAG: energy-coupling factor ABC transporter permease, partial [Myxococcota bacterium]